MPHVHCMTPCNQLRAIESTMKMGFVVKMTACSLGCLLCVLQAASVSTIFTPTNAACPGQTMVFVCSVTTNDGLVWQVNGATVAIYYPGLHKNGCFQTIPFPSGYLGEYCGYESNTTINSNLTFKATLEQNKWNVTCLGSDASSNDITVINVAKRTPLTPSNMSLNCSDLTLSWTPSLEDYVDNYTLQIQDDTYVSSDHRFQLQPHQLNLPQNTFSLWASNCHGHSSSLTASFNPCKSCNNGLPSLSTKLVSAVWSISSLVSLVICITTLTRHLARDHCQGLNLCFNDAETNLMIFLILSGIMLLLVNSIQMFVYITESNTTDWCKYLGFVYQLALDTIVVITIMIEIYLFLSKNGPANTKSIYLIIYFAPPVLAGYIPSYVPIIQDCYGDSGAWCWISIRAKHDPNDIVNGAFYQQMFIWYAKIVVVLAIGIALLSIRQYHYERPNTRFIVMLWHYFISFSIANCSGLINRILTWSRGDSLITIQILQALAFTWWPVITALPIMISEEKLVKLGRKMHRDRISNN